MQQSLENRVLEATLDHSTTNNCHHLECFPRDSRVAGPLHEYPKEIIIKLTAIMKNIHQISGHLSCLLMLSPKDLIDSLYNMTSKRPVAIFW